MNKILSSKVRVALIGFGYWGPNLLRNLSAHRGMEVIGVIDQRVDSRTRCQGAYPHVPVFDSLAYVLNELKPDAVVIATPPQSHASLAIQCMEAGADVLIEKPLALSSADCDRVIETAARFKRRVMVDHTFVYNPAVQYINKQFRSGQIGKPLYYNSNRVNFGGFQTGTNVLWDLAPHDLSILDLLFDGKMPERVSATGASHFAPHVEDFGFIHLHYDDNFSAHLHLSWVAPLKIRTVVLGGSQQMVIYDEGLPGERVKFYDKGLVQNAIANSQFGYRVGAMVAPVIPEIEALSSMVQAFHDYVTTGSQPTSNAHMAARIVRILEAATESMRSGGDQVKLGDTTNAFAPTEKKAA